MNALISLPIKKLLVANRGEIAIRIFRAASEIDVKTVAIYTYEDRYSLHRYKADEAYQVGANDDPLKPYLDIKAIIKIAKDTNVDAIHPGYGFLSENENFAEACIEAGIIWIGPTPEAMKALGDKISAKKVALKAGVPIVEASPGEITDAKTLHSEAERIGFPIMVKAAYGGGGRGMRVVRDAADLDNAFKEASGEAKTAFGNPAVFVEKYIDDPKHIEVQLLGDNYGNLIHLFERDCSVQRRFQKVVEVAPAISLTAKTKTLLHNYAVAIGNEVSYQNAGTVEFLVDADENIYFIEVNTRIQVEHTITEVITGVDIVRSQIMIASGMALTDEKLNLTQDLINYRGVAIQCRITTEDPSENFKPDYGRLVAYRSASGFGIRLDAGNAYAGSTISPFFDSMLVKVTAWGNDIEDSANRLHRALREFRIRGVKSNISFLLNLLKNEEFRNGQTTVHFISRNPHLLDPPKWKDRGTKLIRYIANTIINGNGDVKQFDPDKEFDKPIVPANSLIEDAPYGTKQLLNSMGPEAFADWIKAQKSIHFTDTTFRDAHQSLLATRVRTQDLLNVSESYSKHVAHNLFSMEVWGGATFDVSMRFLKECPWDRLREIRRLIPNTLLQMLLRGSNAVGYKAYPDNLVEEFIVKSWETGIDIFRIFDSLNWLEAMKTSIRTVKEKTGGLAEVCICYTGDVLDASSKYNIDYYKDLAKRIEDEGAHILAIKDMAGLLKPYAAEYLIGELKSSIDMPIHLHTHDTSSIQSATYLKAVDAGVDVIDVALSAVSGLTSQPSFNSIHAMLQGHERENQQLELNTLNQFSNYWEDTRKYYYPFETELKAGTAEVYEHEIPGGQYSNLKPQAKALGLSDQFDTVKKNYQAVNEMLGGIVKVTPSSKVVGDMALFMTANKITVDDIREKGQNMAFPDSMVSLMRGELGQRDEGWPEWFQNMVLKNEKPFTDKPNAHLEPIDFEKDFALFQEEFPDSAENYLHFLSFKLYPRVFGQYYKHKQQYSDTSILPTPVFFYGLKPNNEIGVNIAKGKHILIEFLNANEPNQAGERLLIFNLNGTIRSVAVRDKSVQPKIKKNIKADLPEQIGSPLQGSLSKILVKEGTEVNVNDPLFIIEAMKMESTITSTVKGVIKQIYLKEKTLVEQNDAVLRVVTVE